MNDSASFYIKQIKQQRITEEKIYPLSSSNNEYLLLYVINGQGTVYYDDTFLGIKKDDLLIIDLQKDFYFSSDQLSLISIIFGGSIMQEIIPDNYLFTIHNHQDFIAQYKIMAASKDASLFQQLKQTLLLFDFLYDNRNQYRLNLQDDPINQAIRYIENHFTETISLDEIAKHVRISKFHFIRLFKAFTNFTPYQYILQMRLEHSKYLLRYTSKKIAIIANEIGFQSDISYVNSFIKHMNQSPSTYRKSKES